MFTLVVGQVVAALDRICSFINLAVGPLDALALGPVRLEESRMPAVEVVPARRIAMTWHRVDGVAAALSREDAIDA